MPPVQNSHWSLGREGKKSVIQTAAHLEPHTFWIRYRTDKVAGEKNHDHRFVLASNYRFASLAEIVLWFSASLPAVAMVPNATGTGAFCQADLGRCT